MTDAHDVTTAMPAAEHLGIELVRDTPDEVICRLHIGDRHLNQGLIGHGGVLFMIADTALGLLTNPPDLDRPWVGTSFSVQLFRGAAVGDVVRAVARRDHRSRSLQAVRATLEREADGVVLGAVTGQLLLGPAPRPAPDGTPGPTLHRTDASDPLVRALIAAARREDPGAPDAGDPLAVVRVGEQPCGFATLDTDGRAVSTWLHPRWRGLGLAVPSAVEPGP